MEVILQENFPTLGYVGDRVRVKNGYARNYLIPRGVAVEANSKQSGALRHNLERIAAKRAKLRASAEDTAKGFSAIALEFPLRMGESGKSFGAITARDIETALKAQSLDIDRRQIRLSEPLKHAGEYKVEIRLHSEVSAPIVVKVVSLEAPSTEKGAKAATGKEKGKKRSARGAKKEGAPEEEASPIEADQSASEE